MLVFRHNRDFIQSNSHGRLELSVLTDRERCEIDTSVFECLKQYINEPHRSYIQYMPFDNSNVTFPFPREIL